MDKKNIGHLPAHKDIKGTAESTGGKCTVHGCIQRRYSRCEDDKDAAAKKGTTINSIRCSSCKKKKAYCRTKERNCSV